MSTVVDMRGRQRLSRESVDQQRLRAAIELQLRGCGLSPVRIANAVAEGKRWQRLNYPFQSCVSHSVTWAIGSREPTPPQAA